MSDFATWSDERIGEDGSLARVQHPKVDNLTSAEVLPATVTLVSGQSNRKSRCHRFKHVTGSCLSYGHACWGAHGKRSAHQPNNLRLLPATKAMSSDVRQDSAMPFGNDQWIMSRLIDTRRLVPLIDNYSEQWDTLRKERTLAHRRPNDRKRQTISENDANEGESNDKEAQDFLQAAKDEREDTPEIILISRSSPYKERESKPQDLDLFKLLAKDSEDYK